MAFEVSNLMKMSFYIGFGDGMGLLLQVNWLLNEDVDHVVRIWMEEGRTKGI